MLHHQQLWPKGGAGGWGGVLRELSPTSSQAQSTVSPLERLLPLLLNPSSTFQRRHVQQENWSFLFIPSLTCTEEALPYVWQVENTGNPIEEILAKKKYAHLWLYFRLHITSTRLNQVHNESARKKG